VLLRYNPAGTGAILTIRRAAFGTFAVAARARRARAESPVGAIAAGIEPSLLP
jgi:hypothetical protein